MNCIVIIIIRSGTEIIKFGSVPAILKMDSSDSDIKCTLCSSNKYDHRPL